MDGVNPSTEDESMESTARASMGEHVDVVVVVHGIGDQTFGESLQEVIHRLLGGDGLPEGVSLGELRTRLEQEDGWASFACLPGFGFTEVFWADVGRRAEFHVLEETVHWTRTISARLASLSKGARDPLGSPRAQSAARLALGDLTFALAQVRGLNRLLRVLGTGSRRLDQLLARYLGDVQLLTEYGRAREEILARFDACLESIRRAAARRAQGKTVRIHIVAHSQGSVVALLGLLRGRARGAPWITGVRTLFTFGSPIDVFLMLWPELWAGLGDSRDLPSRDVPPIKWINAKDEADPLGLRTQRARSFVAETAPGFFDAEAPVEWSFSRSAVPGWAHLSYWQDQSLFADWRGACLGADEPDGPPNRLHGYVARLVPFLAIFGLALAAAHFAGSADEGMATPAGVPRGPSIGLGGVLSLAAILDGLGLAAATFRVGGRLRWFLLAVVFVAAGLGALWARPEAVSLWNWALAAALLSALSVVIARSLPNRSPVRRMAAVGVGLLAVAGSFAWATRSLSPLRVTGLILDVAAAIVFWALGVLGWSLFILWREHGVDERCFDAMRTHLPEVPPSGPLDI